MKYYIMATSYAAKIGMTGATYSDGKFTLSGSCPLVFGGTVVDISDKEDIYELLSIIDRMSTTEPTGILLVMSRWFGRYLYENHPAFKPKHSEEI